MRQPRFTFPGAFHHCVNRAHGDEGIFGGEENKQKFIELLAEKIPLFRLRLFAYCLMDNHYHLVLENSSGRMSDFFRNLNTQFASHYRRAYGGRGYVFQSRFYSTLIEDETYLRQAIAYVLANPVRATISKGYRQYPWSSGAAHFGKKTPAWIDAAMVEELFASRSALDEAVTMSVGHILPVQKTHFGPILGAEDFLEKAVSRFERRQKPDAKKKRRTNDFGFVPVEQVIWEFERKRGERVETIKTHGYAGKRLRAELLVLLREQAGLTNREISEMPLFAELNYKSLSQIYKNARN